MFNTFLISFYKLSSNCKSNILTTRYYNFQNNYNIVLSIPVLSNDILAFMTSVTLSENLCYLLERSY